MSTAPDFRLEARLVSDPRYLTFVRLLSGETATVAGFPEELRDRIELAVVEGYTNVIRHAYGGRRDLPVVLRATARPGELRIELEDRGTWVDPSKIASRPLEEVRPGGLGVHLMKTTMDVVEYRRNEWGGTTLVLEKRGVAAPGGTR